jgi:putative hydroxymethylpyrimidine transporter CytX
MASIAERIAVRIPEDGGIEPVPTERRRLRGFDFAILWGDLAVSLLVMVAGTLLVPGLGTQEALLAIVVGTGLGTVLLSLAGIAGSDTGVPTMVALRGPMGVRGSYLPSAINVMQLVGWAALEIIIMAQAAKALSNEYLGFSGYYFWIGFFGVVGTLMAMGGPIVVVREFLQKFGVWIVLLAGAWLTYHLFDAYDVGEIWQRDGVGPWPNFWQGVDVVVALPVSWLPLVCDYSRFAKRAGQAAIGTYIGYALANAWFFFLGMMYVQALQTDTPGFIDAFVGMMLPLAFGWLALIVLLFGETDEAFANIYSTAVSLQNLVPWLKQRLLALLVGAVAIVVAISIDLVQYENFLLLIGGVFVPVFGIFLTDYYLIRRRRYQVPQLYESSGEYWYANGFGYVAIAVWACGFFVYAFAGQPPWLIQNLDFVSWVPTWATHVGGTIPGLLFSSVVYYVAARALLLRRAGGTRVVPASAGGGVE